MPSFFSTQERNNQKMREENLRRNIEMLRMQLNGRIERGESLKNCQKLSEKLDELIWRYQVLEKTE